LGKELKEGSSCDAQIGPDPIDVIYRVTILVEPFPFMDLGSEGINFNLI